MAALVDEASLLLDAQSKLFANESAGAFGQLHYRLSDRPFLRHADFAEAVRGRMRTAVLIIGLHFDGPSAPFIHPAHCAF